MISKFNRRAYKVLRFIPVLRDVLLIVNAYAWAGDPRFVQQFASFSVYRKRIINKVLVCIVLSLLTIFVAYMREVDLSKIDMPGLNFGMFPSLLGFGIGVYALIFIFPRDLLAKLDRKQREGRRRVGAQGMNTAIAYPLAVLLLILLLSVFLRFMPPSCGTVGFGIFMAYYGLVMCLELVAFMLMAAKRLIDNSTRIESTLDLDL